MLYKTIVGNLGNQLFQYAALRGIQAKDYPNEDICLSFTAENYRTGERVEKPNWMKDFSLRPYKIADTIRPYGLQRVLSGAVGEEIQFRQRGIPADRIAERRQVQHEVEVKRQPLLNRFGLFQMQDGFYPFRQSSVRDKYFTGYFESEKYFAQIADGIRAEFRPSHPPLAENAALYQRMAETESVCVSVRRGDFVGTEIDSYANLCGKDYYISAMERMHGLVPNAEWFFFSDDIEWVKANIPAPGRAHYERGSDPVWEKLRLMASCRHFIIANSTFAWWAQYLSENPGKVIVAPSEWRRNSPRPDICQANWTLIDV